MKYTRKEVLWMFERLVKAMNKRIDRGNYDGLHLDYVGCYGGYVIEEYDNEKGTGVSHPFGCTRRNAREMYLSMWMTTIMLEELDYQKRHLEVK